MSTSTALSSPKRSNRSLLFAVLSLSFVVTSARVFASEPDKSTQENGLAPILTYISSGWDTLTRSMMDCQTVIDPKLTEASVLYLPADFAAPTTVQDLQKRCKVQVRPLPAVITAPGQIDPGKIAPGLLYLENKYVVPGGRFNEMYGWDSYFIILGLLRDGGVDPARGMVENFFFEIEHYATILNANRTYYLTRSQPPFLSEMVLAVYRRTGDKQWLRAAIPAIEKYYAFWINQ